MTISTHKSFNFQKFFVFLQKTGSAKEAYLCQVLRKFTTTLHLLSREYNCKI